MSFAAKRISRTGLAVVAGILLMSGTSAAAEVASPDAAEGSAISAVSGGIPAAVASQPGGGFSWCRANGVLCVWAQPGAGGAGDYWSGSDPSWHSGVGTNVADDDDSASNNSGMWVKTFYDVNYGGRCEWISSSPADWNALSDNDDGSSHLRSTSKPSC